MALSNLWKTTLALLALGVAAGLAAGCGGMGGPGAGAPSVHLGGSAGKSLEVLEAARVAVDPVIDGDPSDPVWDGVQELVLGTGEGMKEFNCSRCHLHNGPPLRLKAVFTGQRISFLARWPDSTASLTRPGSYVWHGDDNEWEYLDPETVEHHHAPGRDVTGSGTERNDDRIAFFFPVGAILGDDFNTGGCMTKCHVSDRHPEDPGIDDEAYLAGGMADLWHVMMGRTLPHEVTGRNLVVATDGTYQITAGTLTMRGYADDWYFGAYHTGGELLGGRYLDEGHGAYEANAPAQQHGHSTAAPEEETVRPAFMETNPTDFLDAMVLTHEEVQNGECVGSETEGVSDADAALYWPNYAALNAVVPEIITKDPEESRGDIIAAARWEDGYWTAEISRLLVTGNPDDVQFTPGGESVCGVAIFDHTGGHGHQPTDRFLVRLSR